ncbi:MAG: hypothetical protein J5846_00225 [Desulfovibrio sp.]|nr:hypothetical protein [Desulfovibrio sp.]
MLWQFNYTAFFVKQVRDLQHDFQRKRLAELMERLKQLDDPRDKGGPYLNAWAYIFSGKSMVLCEIYDDRQIVEFFRIIL